MSEMSLKQINVLKNKERPNARRYINYIFKDFIELKGDRLYGDDPALIGGIAMLHNQPVTVIAQMRGNNVEESMNYNYSMMHPEGYRKALRLMKQAEKFGRPIVCMVDTIGAYPGIAAEDRGQAQAIANNLIQIMQLKVPIITIVIGNGGSGGALALCVADRICILENAVLSVISPKACAEILWKNPNKEVEAFEYLQMTSHKLLRFGIVDHIVDEPSEGAQTSFEEVARNIKKYLEMELKDLTFISVFKLLKLRRKKFRVMGIGNINE